MDYAFEIEGLRKEYSDFALKDVSFRLPRGYIMGLIGPNGAGKTTIVKLMMNLVCKDGGEIRIFNRDNIAYEADVKSRIGFVYDVPSFHEDRKLKQIKAAIAPFYPKWSDTAFQTLAEEFELPLGKKFKKLSHGMKSQFALALALSHDADLIIMDEPTAGLDPVFRRRLLGKLSGLLQDAGKSILFSTHITSDLERIADYITFIRGGEIVFSSKKDEILERWGMVKGGEELLQGEIRPLLKSWKTGNYGCEALTDDIDNARCLLGRGEVAERATLDDIIYFLNREGNDDA